MVRLLQSLLVFALAATTFNVYATTPPLDRRSGDSPDQATGPSTGEAMSLSERTASMQHFPGLLPLDWDAKTGKLYLEVPLTANADHTRSADLIYAHSLPYGMGSNDVGLDRGQVSRGELVHFERTGPKLLLVEPNLDFRTNSDDPAAQLAVAESFPTSVLAGFTVDAESADGTVLVDATQFFLSDMHHVAEALAGTGQGNYRVDAARSTITLDHTRTFPKNTEVEAELTFVPREEVPEPKGKFVMDVTPDPRAMTVHEHQSFLEAPPPGISPCGIATTILRWASRSISSSSSGIGWSRRIRSARVPASRSRRSSTTWIVVRPR
jgi:hypothetical protein